MCQRAEHAEGTGFPPLEWYLRFCSPNRWLHSDNNAFFLEKLPVHTHYKINSLVDTRVAGTTNIAFLKSMWVGKGKLEKEQNFSQKEFVVPWKPITQSVITLSASVLIKEVCGAMHDNFILENFTSTWIRCLEVWVPEISVFSPSRKLCLLKEEKPQQKTSPYPRVRWCLTSHVLHLPRGTREQEFRQGGIFVHHYSPFQANTEE